MQRSPAQQLPAQQPRAIPGPRAAMAAAALLACAMAGVVLLPAPPPAQAQAAAKPRTIKVKEGDTLEVLAGRHGVSVEALQKLNGITDPRTLQIDQVLKLPPVTKPRPAAAKPTPKPAAKPAAPAPAKQPPAKAPAAKAPPAQAAPAKAQHPVQQPAQPAAGPAAKPEATPAAQPAAAAADPAQPGEGRWRYFGNTLVDWGGWKLHPGGLRVTVVQPSADDVGAVRAKATAVAVQCSTLRQTWRVDGAWQEWTVPTPRSVAQQIVLDLCEQVKDPTDSTIPPPTAGPGL
ncbi:LysM domain-containing protein [Cyanobium sp. NIES-981]|uniref:LysM peptidoglycan-binding domain-containing protein n=1 Tax=Cyanobium sp. NIES-981 TaxID=1851505 RepID=UPI0007DD3911|nr:LysM domain-containing protein [Cyanobium sp. NIES-981]SBO41854.1 conserved protein of unknown function [Cyanobium sp. NIES-981]